MNKGRGRRAPLVTSDDMDMGEDWEDEVDSEQERQATRRELCKAEFVTRQDRMRAWALLRHPKCGSVARMIPKDVCRIVARFLEPQVVVLGGGIRRLTACVGNVANKRTRDGEKEEEDSDEDLVRSVLVMDWSQRRPGWQWAWRQPLLEPLQRGKAFDARAVVPDLTFDNLITASDPATGGVFVGAFRQSPVACRSCRGEEGHGRANEETEGSHCCCCCPHFFFAAPDGRVLRLPNAHTWTVGAALVVFDGHLYRIGGELLADHWVFDGCPTCNAATDSVERLCVAPEMLSGERDFEAWQAVEKLPSQRVLAAAVAVGEALLVMGGANGNAFSGYAATDTVFELTKGGKWYLHDELRLPQPLAHFEYVITV